MPHWIHNIPETCANTGGWRTDIDLSVLGGLSYDTAEYLLEDGTAICISMAEMQRALRCAPVRYNLKVGPFNVNPHRSTVNDCIVHMTVKHRTA